MQTFWHSYILLAALLLVYSTVAWPWPPSLQDIDALVYRRADPKSGRYLTERALTLAMLMFNSLRYISCRDWEGPTYGNRQGREDRFGNRRAIKTDGQEQTEGYQGSKIWISKDN